ncbi:Nonribosomal peptide synthetase 7 [Cytospora mali]|uniref:Nonribosomal peptide synthetase 7 n=1 Tax=Cytospora mali TaxID=578113 RepID=A0A194VSH5_CYTMA|nr:Nonribosomal peptide synthetase 7 [Valsa mali]
MTPRLLLPFWSFPLLPSGKINRKILKELVEDLEPGTLARYTSVQEDTIVEKEEPQELTETEKVMKTAWAELFDVDEASIRTSDRFYDYGGDSIAAINLVSMLRHLNWSLSVNDAVSYPSLREQATRLKPAKKIASSVHNRLRKAGITEDDIEFLTQGHTVEQSWQLMTVRQVPAGFDLVRWKALTAKFRSCSDNRVPE